AGTYWVQLTRSVNNTWTTLYSNNLVTLFADSANPYYHLRFEVLGDTLSLYVDGVLLASYQDSTIATGEAGVAGQVNSTFANFVVHKFNTLASDTFTGSSSAPSWDVQAGSFTFDLTTAHDAVGVSTLNVATARGLGVADGLAVANVTLTAAEKLGG